MGEMVERVALAIWRKREEGLPDRLKRCTPDNLDRATGAWAMALEEARAAIEAMREPTPEMVETGAANIAPWWSPAMRETDSFGDTRKAAASCWPGMIDAALPSHDRGQER